MLATLGSVDLALALLRQLWPQGKISDATAILLINKGLPSPNRSVKIEAVDLANRECRSGYYQARLHTLAELRET